MGSFTPEQWANFSPEVQDAIRKTPGFSAPGQEGTGGFSGTAKRIWGGFTDMTDRDPNDLQGELGEQADKSSSWGDESRDRVFWLSRQAQENRKRLEDVATGRESVSAMQLAQSLQQNQAQQQSMAAGARPGNAAMAARTAAMTAGRQGAGLAGQQAIAGIQERQAAQSALSQALLTERGQDVNATTQGYGNAASAYGSALGAALKTPSDGEKALGFISGAGKLFAMGG